MSAAVLGFVGEPVASQGRHHEVHFPRTPYELNIYRIFGREPGGPTLMIIGGIQGDEPGGFLAADRYVDLTLRKGNLILVPRANFYSILKKNRGPHGDMNRRFMDIPPVNYMDRIVEIIKALMEEADCLLNLHDGSGFYSPRWEGPQRNPRRYGQSIIADASTYVDQRRGRVLELEELGMRVIRRVNAQIRNEKHHFLFNNHRTLERDTTHPEQRTSATYYALTRVGIPAFGVETSKDIPDYQVRIQYQTMVINAFLEEIGIVPDHPPLALDPPQLQYLLVSINRQIPLAVADKEILQVGRGDVIQVEGVVANYQRGITVDVAGLGSENDLQKPMRIEKGTTILVRKESQVFGQVQIRVQDRVGPSRDQQGVAVVAPRVKYFLLEVGGEKKVVENHGNLKAVLGDSLTVLDILTEGVPPEALKVNFIGFVRDEKDNSGEDRGALVRSAKDLWPRYALDPEGRRYRIVALQGNSLLGEMTVEFQPPRMHYLVIAHDGTPPTCYMEGTQLKARPQEELRILDVRSNVTENSGVTLHFRGDGGSLEKRDDGWVLVLRESIQKGEIVASREGIPMGRVFLHCF